MSVEENNDNSFEERVSITDGLKEVGKMVSNSEDYVVESDDETLKRMKRDLEKKIAKCNDPAEKAESEKELLILQILILQREKIDREAAVILNDGNAFGIDLENDKKKKKRQKEKEKAQQALIDKLNELNISNLDIDIKPPEKLDSRERGGMEREQRTR